MKWDHLGQSALAPIHLVKSQLCFHLCQLLKCSPVYYMQEELHLSPSGLYQQ